jgi:periplasmic protein CpxP/Spy
MTTQRLARFCLALCIASPAALWALPQDSSAPPQAQTPPSPEQVVTMLANKLSLSDDQRNAILPIVADRQQKMRALMSDTGSSRMQRGREARQVMSDSDAKIKAILTPEQQAKYAQIEEQMREQMKQRMQEKKAAGAT